MGKMALGRRHVRTLIALLTTFAVAAAWLAVGRANGAQATVTELRRFNTAGYHHWTVPAGVTSITFDVFGASGGRVTYSQGGVLYLYSSGGPGGEAKGTFKVKPGQTFEIVVGGAGATTNRDFYLGGPGGFNGGGDGGDVQYVINHQTIYYAAAGGGGSSDVRIGGRRNLCASGMTCTDYDRFIVAGGGGGGGSDADQPDGGAGGGLTGAASQDGATVGGAQEPPSCPPDVLGRPAPDCGAFGVGGSGYYGKNGGGGGGGWFGGFGSESRAGGGGGSGYVSSLAMTSSFPSGTHTGDGLVIITTG